MISPDFRNVELLDGERVVWTGKPSSAGSQQGRIPQASMGIVCTAVALAWMLLASGVLFGGPARLHAPSFAIAMFAFPFLCIGLTLMFASSVLARRQVRNKSYVLTDRRAIIITAGKVRSLKGYDLNRIVGTEKLSMADNSGSIIFDFGEGTSPVPYYGANRGANTITVSPPGFWNIADVDSVHRLIEETRRASNSSA